MHSTVGTEKKEKQKRKCGPFVFICRCNSAAGSSLRKSAQETEKWRRPRFSAGEHGDRNIRCGRRSIGTRFTLTSQSGVEMSVMIGSQDQSSPPGFFSQKHSKSLGRLGPICWVEFRTRRTAASLENRVKLRVSGLHAKLPFLSHQLKFSDPSDVEKRIIFRS